MTFNPLWPVAWILLLAAAAFAGTAWAYGSGDRTGSRVTRAVLFGMRCAALVVALLCLLRPSIRRVKVYEEKARLALLTDCSESMSVCDGPQGRSRAAELNAGLLAQQRRLDALHDRFEVHELWFGSEVRAAGQGPVPAEDPSTGLGDGLQAALAEAQGRRLAAVVVLSDGSHNMGADPQLAAESCRQLQAPLVTVGYGKATGTVATRDVKVRAVRCPRTLYVRNRLAVEAELVFLGCAGSKVKVRLMLGDKVVDTKLVQVDGQRETLPLELQHTPTEAGTYKVKVVAEPAPQEIVTANNEMASFVRVLPGGFNVLYLEGRPRPEYKFLRRCFEEAAGMEIVAPLVFTFQGRVIGQHVPATVDEWRQYDLLILGDVASAVFRPSNMQDLFDTVSEHGMGLLVIAGVRNFAAGGYAHTPLSRLLPVEISTREAQRNEEFQLTPTREGLDHYALRLEPDPALSRQAWQELPPLKGRLEMGRPKHGATVLATDGKGAPVLVAHRYGRGRVMAFGADTTWGWVLSEKDKAAHHKRFWRQMALWLAGREDKGDDVVFLNLEEVRYPKGEKVTLRAVVEDKDSRPVEDAIVTAKVTGPDGRESSLALRYDSGHYRAAHFPADVGDYEVAVSATRQGKPIGADRGRFLVYERNLELDEPAANLAALRGLAQITGGAYFPSAQLAKALDHAAGLKSEAKVKKTETLDIWDNPLAFYAFTVLLCLEWVFRKVLGMV